MAAAIAISFFCNSCYAMDLAPELEGMSYDISTAKSDVIYEDYFDRSDLDKFEFGLNESVVELPTVGGLIGGAFRYITPSFSYLNADSTIETTAKYVANGLLKKGTKEGIKALPGGGIIASAYGVYSKDADVDKGEGTIARLIGDKVKVVVENCTGNLIVDAAENLKAGHTKTLTESALLCLAPVTSISLEGETSDIAGSIARSMIITNIPFGTEITQATGYLGRKYFGTNTLTAGILNSFSSMFDTTAEDASGADDDEDSY